MNANIELLNQKLTSLSDTSVSLRLSGKMGYCIYFYLSGQSDDKHTETADSLLDSITWELKNHHHSIDLYNGLSGIGLGIDYLIKNNFITGYINQILKQVDSRLLTLRTFSNNPLGWFDNVVLLHYYNIRIRAQESNSEKEYIFKRAIFKILNEFRFSDNLLFEEPYSFSMQYRLPILLYVLSELYDTIFFKEKIEKMISELSHKVLSIIPVLYSHRIYLILAMFFVSRKMKLPHWDKHIHLLRMTMDIESMWKEEFKEKNMFFMEGLTGIIFLITQYNDFFEEDQQIEINPLLISQRIEKSHMFDRCISDDHFLKNNSGLTGYCGLSLLYKYINPLL